MNERTGKAAHTAVTVVESTAATSVTAVLAAGGLVVVGHATDWPGLIQACLAGGTIGAASRLALEVPDLVRGVRDQHKKAHRWIDDHTTKKAEVVRDTTTKGSGVPLEEGVERSEATDDELRELNVE